MVERLLDRAELLIWLALPWAKCSRSLVEREAMRNPNPTPMSRKGFEVLMAYPETPHRSKPQTEPRRSVRSSKVSSIPGCSSPSCWAARRACGPARFAHWNGAISTSRRASCSWLARSGSVRSARRKVIGCGLCQ